MSHLTATLSLFSDRNLSRVPVPASLLVASPEPRAVAGSRAATSLFSRNITT